MKTNEELTEMAEEYARKSWGAYYDDMHPEASETVGEMTIKDFIKGYQAAQEEMKQTIDESKKIKASNDWTNSRSWGNREENRNTYYDFFNGIEWTIKQLNIK